MDWLRPSIQLNRATLVENGEDRGLPGSVIKLGIPHELVSVLIV